MKKTALVSALLGALLFSSAALAQVTMPQARNPSGQRIPAAPVVVLNPDGTVSSTSDATAANQVTGNSSLSSIDSKASTTNTSLGQIHTDAGTTIPAAVNAPQANAGSDASKAVAVQGITGGKAVPVSGTFYQATQPVSAASLPLPTNAMPATGGTVGIVAGSQVIGHVIVDTASTTAVTQATASNLNATVVGTGTFAVQSATTPAARTIVPLDIATVTTGGTAVTALSAGHRTAGGFLLNPVAATIYLCINEQGTASGTTSAGALTCIAPGQSYTLAPTSGAVSVITSDSSHPFAGYGLN